MPLEYPHLAALVAVVREGSFEGAAQALHVTPSAISQRIKLLEDQIGAVTVQRGSCQPTPAGEALYRHGLQVELLEKDLLRRMVPNQADVATGNAPIGIAVNADSLATWLIPVLRTFTEQTGLCVEIVVDDQDHTAAWLRSGRVLGAITADARAVQGCRVSPVGAMRYRATATPGFVRRWFKKGFNVGTVRRAPVLMFNRKDLLQERFIRSLIKERYAELPMHFVPSPNAFLEACLAGLGWGLNPEPLVAPHLKQKQLVDVVPGAHLDIPLYCQQWALDSPTLQALETALQAQARLSLHVACS
jgi:LysR family transcriptional regulator (chromosome initiation inhibitor)